MATPKYYIGKYKGIEAMDVVLDFQRDNYNIGVAIAYLLRAGKKKGNPTVQDLEKAVVHLQREIEFIKTFENAGKNNTVSKHQVDAGASPLYFTSSTGENKDWKEQVIDREGPWGPQRGPIREAGTGQDGQD